MSLTFMQIIPLRRRQIDVLDSKHGNFFSMGDIEWIATSMDKAILCQFYSKRWGEC